MKGGVEEEALQRRSCDPHGIMRITGTELGAPEDEAARSSSPWDSLPCVFLGREGHLVTLSIIDTVHLLKARE